MSDVPWAPGRKALVLTSRGWRGCVGMAAGRHRGWLWTCPSRDFMGEPSTTEVFETTRDGEQLPTALLPDQCPRCYFVDGHEDGCMVAANIARGVRAFWAPWAMWALPVGEPTNDVVVYALQGARLVPTYRLSMGEWYGGDLLGALDGLAVNVPLVAFGRDGLTLAPWGKS